MKRINLVIADAKNDGLTFEQSLTTGQECIVLLFKTKNNNQVVRKFSNPDDEKVGKLEMENEFKIFEILKKEINYKKYVVTYRGHKILNDFIILEFEYASSGDLEMFLENKKINSDNASTIMSKIIDIYFYLHFTGLFLDGEGSFGILHNGIGLRNFFVKEDGDIVLGDFGKSSVYIRNPHRSMKLSKIQTKAWKDQMDKEKFYFKVVADDIIQATK